MESIQNSRQVKLWWIVAIYQKGLPSSETTRERQVPTSLGIKKTDLDARQNRVVIKQKFEADG
jgi:hypothetical protein